jgi:quinol monooxygenase YgiN
MDTNEWCAIAHIDFRSSFADRGALIAALQPGKGPSFEEGEQVLRALVAAGHPPGTVETLSLVAELAAAQSADASMSGQVLLQRRCRPSNLELISVWPSSEAFEEHLASGSAQAPRSALASRLVAPVDARPHRLFAGRWMTP